MQISGLLEEHIHIHQKTGATVQTTHPSTVQTTHSPKDRDNSTDNTSIKRQGQKYRQTHPPKDRVKSTDNTSTKRQGQQYRQQIHQKTGANVQTTHPPREYIALAGNVTLYTLSDS